MPKKIYTIGKMKDRSAAYAMGWRSNLEAQIKSKAQTKVEFCHPPLFYNYENHAYQTQGEVKEWDLNHLRECDIAVVDLEEINDSVGSHFELALIDCVNLFGGKHIYTIGIGSTEGVHPWITETLLRVEPNEEAAARYIAEYLL